LQLACALTQVGHGVSFKDPYNRVADLLHHTADATGCFEGTRTFFVIECAHAAYRRQRALDMPNDRGEGDGFWRHAQSVSTGYAAFARHNAHRLQVIEYLFQ